MTNPLICSSCEGKGCDTCGGTGIEQNPGCWPSIFILTIVGWSVALYVTGKYFEWL